MTWSVDAPAKVNLRLRVLHRRPDGYHEIDTLFQALELADAVRVSVRPGREGEPGEPAVTLTVDGPDLGPARENLAVRAAEAFADSFGLPGPVHVELVKRIPAGAGLGGGSSDAAAVLRLLARIVEEGGGAAGAVDPTELRGVASTLGSDVPFFLAPSPLARGGGRGERLTPADPLPAHPVVVALPPVHVATPWAYRALSAVDRDAAPRSHASPPEVPDSWDDVISTMSNDFERVVPAEYPEVAASLSGLRESGARGVLLSGSGGACFGLFDDPALAEEAAAALAEKLGWRFVATRTRTAIPEPSAG